MKVNVVALSPVASCFKATAPCLFVIAIPHLAIADRLDHRRIWSKSSVGGTPAPVASPYRDPPLKSRIPVRLATTFYYKVECNRSAPLTTP